jgi:hypothetical protein
MTSPTPSLGSRGRVAAVIPAVHAGRRSRQASGVTGGRQDGTPAFTSRYYLSSRRGRGLVPGPRGISRGQSVGLSAGDQRADPAAVGPGVTRK